MKKLFLIVSLCFLSTLSFAQKKVGSYSVYGVEYDIEAYINDNGTLQVYVEVDGDYPKVMFEIYGKDDLNDFIDKLKKCKEKFVEWSNVAKTNNVKGFNKSFDISFPNVRIFWAGNKTYHSDKYNFIRPLFFVSQEGRILFVVREDATHWDNEYIETKFYFLLSSSKEFDILINALNPSKIEKALINNKKTNELFK